MWSQNATANINRKSRSNPYVYTEQGTYMLAAVLKNDIAVTQSIAIMRAFREKRHYIRQNQQFVTKNELKLLMETTEIDTKSIVARQDDIDGIYDTIRNFNYQPFIDFISLSRSGSVWLISSASIILTTSFLALSSSL